MTLFKSKRRSKLDKKEVPLLSINQRLKIYRKVPTSKRKFGTDLLGGKFDSGGMLLLTSNGLEHQDIPIRCDHFTVALCTRGQTEVRQGYHRFQVNPSSLTFLHPGEIQSYSNTSSDYEEQLLLFERSYLSIANLPPEELESLLDVDPDIRIDPHLNHQEFILLKRLFYQLDQEVKGKADYYQEITRNLIIQLLYLLKRKNNGLLKSPKYSRKEQIYNEFSVLIELHFRLKRSVGEYAELLGISAKHLSETVKLVTNHPALYFIQERVIDESRYLLVHTRLSVKQIASKLNFDTVSHFVRFFKNLTGVTPLKYKFVIL